jgi:signal transduction histidine kinase
MGSRGRSIRLRIFLLVAIPLVTMAGLLAYLTGTLVNNAIEADRAPDLINATSLPAAKFGSYLQTERTAAVVYLFEPTPASLQAYTAATAATDKDEPAFKAAMTSAATVSSQTPSEATAIGDMITGLNQLAAVRAGVKTQVLTPLRALSLYNQGLAANTKLFQAEAGSVTIAYGATQGLGLVAVVQSREALSQEDALLSGMLAGNRITSADRAAFTQMAATRQADMQYADVLLTPANLAAYDAQLNGTTAQQQQVTGTERLIGGGTPVSGLPVTSAGWQALAGTLLRDNYNGGVAAAAAVLAGDHQISRSAWTKVAVTSGFGLIGLLITILVTTLVGRGTIRRLRELERSALALAENQLPEVIARLRRGEEVDVASEAPPLRIGRDEIGRVGASFELVRQTAIRAAVEEAKLRRGLNDVFRSLARRSQSLLHRQLTLLDQMERRATDPEGLDDLFRLDHLTTRMRRHAEGLVILAGAPPSRGWSNPVRMVDVMRGAIAEVEDYARVTVATPSPAALSGSAVADVIHLLAELIENATTLSPPDTSVRVSGDAVANGFAIEIEDRGLGMSPKRLAELNERLARPPEFNPSDSDQLGLFVVSQLAKRHGIRVTLKASAYGGIAAIVLIPGHLVVAEDAVGTGEPAAITVGHLAIKGHDGTATEPGGPDSLPFPGFSGLRGQPGPIQAPGIRISGPPGRGSVPPWELYRETGPLPVTPGGPDRDSAAGEPGSEGDANGLPRRIRQASLAPQLRADPPQRRAMMAGPGPSIGSTPAEIRQNMSALQRGWQEGRSQPAHGPATAAGPGANPGPDENEQGESDGT